MGDPRLRWRLADDPAGQGALFDEVERHVGRGEFRGLEFLHVNAKRLINTLPPGGMLPFRHTVNAYRGCSHACTYCFARPTHTYLGLDAGEDFERRIVVKVNAVERLRVELDPRRWAGEPIAMGTNTDPYQRCEGKYHLTRGIVEVLLDAGNPFSILTKSTLVLRDLDLLAEAAQRGLASVNLSIGTLDEEAWRRTEPGTPAPARRVEAVARLNGAGVPCGVLVAPILPGISDAPEQIEAVVRACVEAGATSVSHAVLHLRPGVREVFMPWLAEARPDLVPRYEGLYRGANAPRAERERIGGAVRVAVERHRGRTVPVRANRVPPGAAADPPGGRASPAPATATTTPQDGGAAADQLRLL